MKDEVLEELWRSKDEIAKECDYSVEKLFEKLSRKPTGGRSTVSLSDYKQMKRKTA